MHRLICRQFPLTDRWADGQPPTPTGGLAQSFRTDSVIGGRFPALSGSLAIASVLCTDWAVIGGQPPALTGGLELFNAQVLRGSALLRSGGCAVRTRFVAGAADSSSLMETT